MTVLEKLSIRCALTNFTALGCREAALRNRAGCMIRVIFDAFNKYMRMSRNNTELAML